MSRFNLPRLIGIAGRAGAGKDTLADYLVRQHGYEKYAFADPLKKILNERYGWTMEMWNDRKWKESPNPRLAINPKTGEHFSPRDEIRWTGTERFRGMYGEDVWVNLMEKRWQSPPTIMNMVISDVRFDNEAARIRKLGGVVIRVVRESADAAEPTHESESGVSYNLIDGQVLNGADVMKFLREAVYLLEYLDAPT